MYTILLIFTLFGCNIDAPPRNEKPTKEAPQISNTVAVEPTSTVTGLFAAKGQESTPRVISATNLFQAPTLPPKNVDILAQLGVNVVNELPELTGITDDMVRAAADVSYNRLGIADESLRGWTLFVRLAANGTTQTSFNDKNKFVIVEIDPILFPYAAPHELTHALAGEATRENWVPGIMGEFMATAAEIYQPPGTASAADFTYDTLNRPILGTGKNLRGEGDSIHAEGAPLDALRYELLRAASRKIGDEQYRTLIKKMYAAVAKKRGPMVMGDFQPIFAEMGLGDCVLFSHTSEPGVYVDLFVGIDHSPVVLTKYIDGTGQESMPNAPFSVTWKKGGVAVNQYQGMASPIFTDNGSIPFAASMDEYVVTVANLSYTYAVDHSGAATSYLTPDKMDSSSKK